MSTDLKKPKKRIKINWSKNINYFLGMILLYYLFFGFIANTGDTYKQEDPGIKILYVYTAFFNRDTLTINGLTWPNFMNFLWKIPCWVSVFIFILIGIFQSYREDFVVYAIKKNIWMIPIIILISLFWYTMAYFGHPIIAQAAALDVSRFVKFFALAGAYLATFFINFAYTIYYYFGNIHALLNVLVLLIIYTASSFAGSAIKCYFYQRAHPIIELEQQTTSVPTLEVN